MDQLLGIEEGYRGEMMSARVYLRVKVVLEVRRLSIDFDIVASVDQRENLFDSVFYPPRKETRRCLIREIK